MSPKQPGSKKLARRRPGKRPSPDLQEEESSADTATLPVAEAPAVQETVEEVEPVIEPVAETLVVEVEEEPVRAAPVEALSPRSLYRPLNW